MNEERALQLADAAAAADLSRFAAAAVRLDPSAVVRLKARAGGRVGAWAQTGFDVLATRSAVGEVRPADIVVDAAELRDSLAAEGSREAPLGWGFDSSWKGSLPPEDGFAQVDDVPVRELVDLAQRGMALIEEHAGPQGPPPSLLDSVVVTATSDGEGPDGEGLTAQVPLRCVFALTAMGFVTTRTGRPIRAKTDRLAIQGDEVVRIRAHSAWLRLDTRFGSVYWRHAGQRLQLAL
ncbi:hypothetical protein [Segniliparus rugosus]|uniref:Uncharacterized protein n=1 Tax=Segniliparus rugosus (strain ATCC BAA-974 / DSM 45345 / CCUG 50838 / CIP 108380 / JCM 13579 / CDC 945) TaxID=679197 RepID=E5XSR1_SEGRC|nr:hypothetical protein [Segniliparus rugosus]EFV12588.1 hypothetical protein HMPREF9336_02533 [Segniliparus rugosus ATCC BAA-974]